MAVSKLAGLVVVIMPLKILRMALSAPAFCEIIAVQTTNDKSNFFAQALKLACIWAS
ncbi:hypothetical protein AC90_4661 [Escherichia coli 3-475-03_S4_C1]|nr:hypothetical protein AC90_4661 [Escherichia coli 3-475-03_S4_C1]KEM34380.1 hypothetical protein AD21_2864 [Escherichia coli 6-319-05_S4_C2]